MDSFKSDMIRIDGITMMKLNLQNEPFTRGLTQPD